MRRVTCPLVFVRTRPGHRQQGWLAVGLLHIPVALGRAGVKANKREGDTATPRGRFRMMRLWWRADRLARPRTLLPARPIHPSDAWCETPSDRRYNRPLQARTDTDGDRLWRADGLYDLIIEIDHNVRPRVVGRGSAVFIHVARPRFAPTSGCVGLASGSLRQLLRRVGPKTENHNSVERSVNPPRLHLVPRRSRCRHAHA